MLLDLLLINHWIRLMQALFGLWISLGLAEIYMYLALWLTEPLVKLVPGVQVLPGLAEVKGWLCLALFCVVHYVPWYYNR
jgi:hypothetical protein